MRALIAMLAIAGCGAETIVFGQLDEGAPAALIVLDGDPGAGILAFEPLPRRVTIDRLGDRAVDILTYDAPFGALGVEIHSGRLVTSAEGAPLPLANHWLHRAQGALTLAPVDLSQLDTVFQGVKLPGPRCPSLSRVSTIEIPDTLGIHAIVPADPTTAILGALTATAGTRLFRLEITAAAKIEDLAETSSAARSIAGFRIPNDEDQTWTGRADGQHLILERRASEGALIESRRIPLVLELGLRRMTGTEVGGQLVILFSTPNVWGRVDLDANTATILGRTTLENCTDGLGGVLTLEADGTGVVGFTNGDLVSFTLGTDAASTITTPLLPFDPRPCRASYARDPASGREVVMTDRSSSAVLYWRSRPTDAWRSANEPTLTARALTFVNGALIASAAGDVVASLAFDGRPDQPPSICDGEPFAAKVLDVVTMGDYVLVNGFAATDGTVRIIWYRVGG